MSAALFWACVMARFSPKIGHASAISCCPEPAFLTLAVL
jgi:hypothetical protein